MKKIGLTTQILAAMAIGVVVGNFFPEFSLSTSFLGSIFIRLLKMIIVPLVFASITVGVVSLGDIRQIRKLGTKTLLTFVITTLIAVSVGFSIANITNPGKKASKLEVTQIELSTPPSLGSVLIDIVPTNIVKALADSQMLSIIFFSILLGCALLVIKEEGQPVLKIIEGLDKIMMSLTQWIMNLAPIGVFSLMATAIAKTGLQTLKPLGTYIITVIAGLSIHAIIILPIILLFFCRVSPMQTINNMLTAIITAFTTSSSGATMPITMDLLTKKIGVPQRIVNFAIPLGTTINMNGTALYQGIAAIFIAQIYGIDLTATHYIIIAITATLAAIAAAAIPSAGLITLIMILNAINVPEEGIFLIFGVDRLLDMFRTATNVWGNTVSAIILTRLEKETLKPEDDD